MAISKVNIEKYIHRINRVKPLGIKEKTIVLK